MSADLSQRKPRKTRDAIPLSAVLSAAALGRRLMKEEGVSLVSAVAAGSKNLPEGGRGTLLALLYGATRRTATTKALLAELLEHAPKEPVSSLLEVSLAALLSGEWAGFTVVNQAVEAVRSHRSTERFTGLVNAVLRRYLRETDRLLARVCASPEVRFNAPLWWIKRMESVYGPEAEAILEAGLRHPPLTIRVNTLKTNVEAYMKRLETEGVPARALGLDAVRLLKPCPVEAIPGFAEGVVSVQDAGTQLAAHFLPVSDGDTVLDACAAPGGKTAHLLEKHRCSVTALEIDPERARRIEDNLDRLGLSAEVLVADASDLGAWWSGKAFDAVLLDAPCTASGVVRRQPDVPWNRRPGDPKALAKTQRMLFKALWPVVKPGGHLLFCTCSIFPEEGVEQIAKFLEAAPDASLVPLGEGLEGMMTLLPTDEDRPETDPKLPAVHDGFFYALFRKTDHRF